MKKNKIRYQLGFEIPLYRREAFKHLCISKGTNMKKRLNEMIREDLILHRVPDSPSATREGGKRR
jgi:hypothetical protein